MKKNQDINFTEGSIVRQLVLFSVPIVLGELFQNLYHTVDSLVIGNFADALELAAITVCDSPTNLLVGFFNGMSLGSSVIVANAFGRGDRKRLEKTIRVSFSFSVLFGVCMAALSIVLAPLLLRISAVREEIFGQALLYMRIYLIGLTFTIIYNIAAGILRAVGDSGEPFRILALSCCINIMLDLLFVVVLHWGLVGVGIATVIAEGISAFRTYQVLKRKYEEFRLDFREMKKEKTIIAELMNVGLPTGLQNSLISISNLFVWRYINMFSAVTVAGIGIAQRLDKFILMPGKALGMTISTFVGQNEGAGRRKRGMRGIWIGMALAEAFAICLSLPLYFFAAPLANLFSRDMEVVATGVAMLRVLAPFYFMSFLREILSGALRGYKKTKWTTILSMLGMIGLRQIYLAVSMGIFTPTTTKLFYCYPVGWVSAALLLLPYFGFELHQLGSKKEEEQTC
ncbi:MAG: MATE family efflux transporter [Lachnospiraceae bacterium]|nr:MATE family efflux transporter [Lachnospiraceae bacterium]